MKIEKEEIPIFVIYAIVFAYALVIQFGKQALPLASVAVPIALSLFVIFILHMANMLFRGKSTSQKE